MCDYYDGTSSSVWDVAWVRSRKAHTCFSCTEGVNPGELYRRTGVLSDGHWYSYRHCATCAIVIYTLSTHKDSPAEKVDLTLNCGETWENPPEDVAAMAFWDRATAQRWAYTRQSLLNQHAGSEYIGS